VHCVGVLTVGRPSLFKQACVRLRRAGAEDDRASSV